MWKHNDAPIFLCFKALSDSDSVSKSTIINPFQKWQSFILPPSSSSKPSKNFKNFSVKQSTSFTKIKAINYPFRHVWHTRLKLSPPPSFTDSFALFTGRFLVSFFPILPCGLSMKPTRIFPRKREKKKKSQSKRKAK